MSAIKAPNPVDMHVGSRVRMRRMMLGITQEKLANALGLSFQQVQKYEKGSNRIGASRLEHISRFLQVPVAFFFEGASDASAVAPRKKRRSHGLRERDDQRRRNSRIGCRVVRQRLLRGGCGWHSDP